jgi:hypothetical protein
MSDFNYGEYFKTISSGGVLDRAISVSVGELSAEGMAGVQVARGILALFSPDKFPVKGDARFREAAAYFLHAIVILKSGEVPDTRDEANEAIRQEVLAILSNGVELF